MLMINLNKMKIFNYLHLWGFTYRKKYFNKWYDGFTGIKLFEKTQFGFWLRDSNRVVDFKTKPFKTERLLKLFIYIVHNNYSINLLNLSKSKFEGNIYINEKDYWYEGYTGIIILDYKFIGFNIFDKIYENGLKSNIVFLYLFGLEISIGKFE